MQQAQTLFTDYLSILRHLDLMQQRFLDIIKIELDKQNIYDIKSDQAILLFLMGEDEVTATELINRGYYCGSNVSYTIKKLTLNGYVNTTKVMNDKRSQHIKLTEKGLKIRKIIGLAVNRHVEYFDRNKLKLEQINYAVLVLRRLYQLLGDFKI